jgi:adenylate cyclase
VRPWSYCELISSLRDLLGLLGVTDAEVDAAQANGTLLALAAERYLLPGERKYDVEELAERSGAEVEDLLRLWLALGFAPPPAGETAYTDDDVEAVRMLMVGEPHLSSEYTLHEARAISAALARIADVLIDEMWDEHRSAGQSDTETLAEMAGVDLGRIEAILLSLLRRHLVAAVYRHVALQGQVERAGQARLCVGFADLTGFTELSHGLTDKELTALIMVFERRACDAIAEMGGRVVKTIGDEVMFTFEVASVAADLALRLVAEDPDLPPLRIGLAMGPVLVRQGDCYGPTVNLASRVAGVARGGEVVVDSAVQAVLRDDPRFVVEALGEVPLRGFGPVALARASRANATSVL